MPYDRKAFRTVKHGVDGASAYCRHCEWSEWSEKDGGVRAKARAHAQKTMHTVDYHQENWTEYTSHVKETL